MKQIRIQDDLHRRLVAHARATRRSLASETEHAITSLLDGQIFTDLAVTSEGDHTIVIMVSDSGGPDLEIDRFSVADVGGIVSRGANLRNCAAHGRTPLQTDEGAEVSRWLSEKGYKGTIAQQVAEILDELEAIESVALED